MAMSTRLMNGTLNQSPIKVQVEGNTDLEHGDERVVGNQGVHEFSVPLGTLRLSASCPVTRPEER